jgi:hypothetical protein
MGAEEQYRNEIDKTLKLFFELDVEVWSVEHRRIDYILRCKKSGSLFGLEVKHINHMRGEKIGEYLLQASDYSTMNWKTKFSISPVKVPIFITPAISNTVKQVLVESRTIIDGNEYYQAKHQSTHEHTNINSMIGCGFNVGEIRSFKLEKYGKPFNYFAFIFNNKPIWRSCDDSKVHEVNYNYLISKI